VKIRGRRNSPFYADKHKVQILDIADAADIFNHGKSYPQTTSALVRENSRQSSFFNINITPAKCFSSVKGWAVKQTCNVWGWEFAAGQDR